MSKIRSVMVSGLVCCFILSGCGRPKKQENKETGGVSASTPRVEFSVPSVFSEGGSVRLGDARGKAVMLNFWGTWDQPCQAELDVLNQLYADYNGREFEMIGLVMDTPVNSEVVAVIREHALVFPNGVATDLLEMSPFDSVRVYPTKYFLNSEHQIVGEPLQGVVSEQQLRQRIEELL